MCIYIFDIGIQLDVPFVWASVCSGSLVPATVVNYSQTRGGYVVGSLGPYAIEEELAGTRCW